MAIQLLNPSDVSVSNLETLSQNFAQNAISTVCQAGLSSGAFAIGSRILGGKPLPPQAALATTAAFLATALLCPAELNPEAVFGKPANFSGGQCSANYGWFQGFTPKGGGDEIRSFVGNYPGPLSVFEVRTIAGSAGGTQYAVAVQGFGMPAPDVRGTGFSPELFDFTTLALTRTDGRPDNCGNPPDTPGQIVVNNNNGDTFNIGSLDNNTNNLYITPVVFNFGGQSFPINMTFGNIEIGSLLPLNFSIEISGTRFGFGQKPDGTIEPRPVNPDPDLPETNADGIQKLLDKLEEIRECVCGGSPVQEIITAFIPVARQIQNECAEQEVPLSVLATSYTAEKAQLFFESARLGVIGCESEKEVPQLEETLIFAATTLVDGRELFTGTILPEVVSLRIKITAFQDGLVPAISIYPAANQRKFGSVAFVSESVNGGGDSVYVYDTETYLPLPRRGKPGKLRILMKPLVSFEVYDTGERL